MTPLSRGVISSGKLGEGDPVEFAAATINLNLTTQYLQMSGSTTRLDLGTDTLGFSTWVYHNGVNATTIMSKYDSFANAKRYLVNIGSSGLIQTSIHDSVNEAVYDAPNTLSVGWHHITYYWERINLSTPPKIWVDGVENVSGFLSSSTGDPTNSDITNTISFRIGGFQGFSSFVYQRSGAFTGVALGQPLTQADATYLYNAGNAVCWPRVASKNSTLYNKFDEMFDLGTFDGSSELQSRTGHVNGWVLDNINAAPFTGTGLTVEC